MKSTKIDIKPESEAEKAEQEAANEEIELLEEQTEDLMLDIPEEETQETAEE